VGEDYNEGKPKDLFRKDRMTIKEEDQDIIIRWKGGKMKVDAVSQCPSRRMDMQ
jgi:hypothetical protein